MKQNHALSGLISALLLLAAGTTTTTSHAALLLDYDAANFNTGTGVWTDTSGNADNAISVGGNGSPTLTPNATPTGQPALTFAPGRELALTSFILTPAFSSSPSFTLLAVERGPGMLLSGYGTGDLGWRINAGLGYKSELTAMNVADIGPSASVVNPADFHLFGVTYDGTTTRFFLDGVADGTAVNSLTFPGGIVYIGVDGGFGSNPFQGDLAALEVYDTVLSGGALASAQSALMGTYIEAVPEPGTLLFGVALVGIVASRRRRATAV
jgi:hypothetical protein